ncbi:hypothetical protein KFK09_022722 [Dendrobium nobile]|uniref:Uncharacterized protein n=1 Tax=Dendrobium nobile TaxID=94219 RepID=A0A8T3AIL6_DENNO|nr:hypothetical protein KFK09_022722 [Dendrobium nobile]
MTVLALLPAGLERDFGRNRGSVGYVGFMHSSLLFFVHRSTGWLSSCFLKQLFNKKLKFLIKKLF